jgi:hypothetical protein
MAALMLEVCSFCISFDPGVGVFLFGIGWIGAGLFHDVGAVIVHRKVGETFWPGVYGSGFSVVVVSILFFPAFVAAPEAVFGYLTGVSAFLGGAYAYFLNVQ